MQESTETLEVSEKPNDIETLWKEEEVYKIARFMSELAVSMEYLHYHIEEAPNKVRGIYKSARIIQEQDPFFFPDIHNLYRGIKEYKELLESLGDTYFENEYILKSISEEIDKCLGTGSTEYCLEIIENAKREIKEAQAAIRYYESLKPSIKPNELFEKLLERNRYAKPHYEHLIEMLNKGDIISQSTEGLLTISKEYLDMMSKEYTDVPFLKKFVEEYNKRISEKQKEPIEPCEVKSEGQKEPVEPSGDKNQGWSPIKSLKALIRK